MSVRGSKPKSHNSAQKVFDETHTISYEWPQLYVPHTSLTRYIVEKFLFYSNQIFLTETVSRSQFTYKHVLLDTLKCAQILRSNCVTSSSTIAIVGGSNYEHVCTLLAGLLLEAKIVLLSSNSRQEQITEAVKKCGVSYLAVIPKRQLQQNVKQFEAFNSQYKNPFVMKFDESSKTIPQNECDNLTNIKSYAVSCENAINSKFLGLQRQNNASNWNRTRLIIPKFKGTRVRKLYYISEFSLMSQLTYATLPQSGFEWNINDVVLNMNPFSELLGILELLVTFSVGARIALNRHDVTMDCDQFAALVQQHDITACIVHSTYLMDLIKTPANLGSLDKILYTEQPIHRNIVSVFRRKYNIHNCRYGYYLLEASGFAAIEMLNYTNNTAISVTPLPSMQIIVINRENGDVCKHGQLGKIFIRSSYCARSSMRPRKDGWVFSGHVGFYDSASYLQVIDHYCNFIKSGQTFISKSLVETVLLSHQAVARAVAMRTATCKFSSTRTDKLCEAFVTLKEGHSYSEEALSHYLNSYLNDNFMKWTVTVVERLVRSPPHNRILTCRLRRKCQTTGE